MEDEQKKKICNKKYFITKNYVKQKYIKDIIPIRNSIEAIIMILIETLIISYIPFVRSVSILVSIIIYTATIIFFLKGIKHRAVFEIIGDEINFKRRIRVSHLRSPEYVRERPETDDEFEGKNFFEILFIKAKRKYKEYIETYAD